MEELNLMSSSPTRLNFEEIRTDLNMIPINQQDVLFELCFQEDDKSATDSSETCEQLEKLIVFKNNLKSTCKTTSMATFSTTNLKNSQFSLKNLLVKMDLLKDRLNSLQSFVDISSKFISLNK